MNCSKMSSNDKYLHQSAYIIIFYDKLFHNKSFNIKRQLIGF